jgi:phosphate acetyltransferase
MFSCLRKNNLNFDELCQRLTNNHSERVTPLMFEYEQIQRAKANIQHIVLATPRG